MPTLQQQAIANLGEEMTAERIRASALLAKFNSAHEALGVIWEEFEEFKAEVFAYNLLKGRDTRPQMREELIQLGAMCMRAIVDLDL